MSDKPVKLNQPDEGVYSTSNGIPYPQPYEAQMAGPNGPLLLQDFHLIDLLAHFDRERIPERVVHAKGAGAYGEWRCTDGLEDITCARMFRKNYKCEMLSRFSTVGGERGTPDCVRDVRGFSLKFYTDEGNVDWVFNNTPVFFIRDPAKFPEFIHTQKRRVDGSNLWHVQDSTQFWDYLSLNPESIHQVMYLFGDRGVPDGFRKMHGYSGHTLVATREPGSSEFNYIQIHCKSRLGFQWLPQDKSVELSGAAPDYSTKDLYDAIENGDYPTWDVYVQVMSPKQAEQFKYNIFDLTKIWPHTEFPLRKVGEFTLNRNVTNYFAEMEQLAFSPSHLPPGIQPSADPVLQSRLFSYPDTHRHRLGVNYQQIPVNAPKAAKHEIANFQRDGYMTINNQGDRPNYYSSVRPVQLPPRKQAGVDPVHMKYVGNAITHLSEMEPIDYEQPHDLWTKVFDDAARERFVQNVSGHMSNCRSDEIKARQCRVFAQVSPDLGERVASALGLKPSWQQQPML